MKRRVLATLVTIIICVMMMLAIGIASGRISPFHAASGVHIYAHVNCSTSPVITSVPA